MDIVEILAQMGFREQARITAFKSEEDGTDHDVWKIEVDNTAYVLKKTCGRELSIYNTFLKPAEYGVPRFYKSLSCHSEMFLLMEYIDGNDMRKCDRKSLAAVLDTLIYLQNMYWERRELQAFGFGFEASLPGRQTRGRYLNDPELGKVYETYLQLYSDIPRTLCHDDLLPFNVLISEDKATMIDWEYAGILPYPTSLARLIAHCEEDVSAFFYMREEDKVYAVEYYFEHLLKDKGIERGDYLRTMDYFLFYEYCEWIMLGVRYGDTGSERFKRYFTKAKEHIRNLT